MIDRLFSLTLTLAVLIGSTLAIGSDLLSSHTDAARTSAVIVLPRVDVTGSSVKPTAIAQASSQSDRIVQ